MYDVYVGMYLEHMCAVYSNKICVVFSCVSKSPRKDGGKHFTMPHNSQSPSLTKSFCLVKAHFLPFMCRDLYGVSKNINMNL